MYRSVITYGFEDLSLEQAKALVESRLEIEMEPENEAYRGGRHYCLDYSGVELILQRNFDEMEDHLAEPEFDEIQSLLFVDGDEAADELGESLEKLLPTIRRLRVFTIKPAQPGAYR